MRLATLRIGSVTVAVRVDGALATEITGYRDVGQLLVEPHWRDRAREARGAIHALHELDSNAWAAVVPDPRKIVCVGLNYRNHILEMGRELPEFPTLFTKYAESLIGPYDPIALPPEAADHVDWEGELAIVIGSRVRRASPAAALDAIAGYTVFNDVTMRDFQYRTTEWTQGKTWERSSPLGPELVTTDEWTPGPDLITTVDGDVVQRVATSDLVFNSAALITYISTIVTLQPGDVIATGTPGGVGHARKPPRYLAPGEVLSTSIDGLGQLRNNVTLEA